MIVDTSVWINHFRHSNADLESLLESGDVVTHPFIVGEIACGSLRKREDVIAWLRALPGAPVASHDEVMAFLARHRLHATGLGWIDVHLLASAKLSGLKLWSADRTLRQIASRLDLTSS